MKRTILDFGTHDDGAAYAAALTQKLAAVPLSRWARVTVSYEIVP